mgnify:CR=1 FL=1
MPWIDIVQTIGIIASILFAWRQMRITAKSIEARTYSEIARRLDQINSILISSPQALAAFSKLNEPYPGQNREYYSEYYSDARAHLMDMFLTILEQAYFSFYKYRFISSEGWNAWRRTAEKLLVMPYAAGHWNRVKDEYPESFREFIDDLIQRRSQ